MKNTSALAGLQPAPLQVFIGKDSQHLRQHCLSDENGFVHLVKGGESAGYKPARAVSFFNGKTPGHEFINFPLFNTLPIMVLFFYLLPTTIRLNAVWAHSPYCRFASLLATGFF
ncbi:MAG: hypothetical protein R2830_00055 [Saprospiraceae bacterium]